MLSTALLLRQWWSWTALFGIFPILMLASTFTMRKAPEFKVRLFPVA
jgi:hypothetical protein